MTDFTLLHFFFLFLGLILIFNVGYYVLFWITSFFFTNKLIETYIDPKSDSPARDRAELLALTGAAVAGHTAKQRALAQARAALMDEEDDPAGNGLFDHDEPYLEDQSMDFLERQRLFGDD